LANAARFSSRTQHWPMPQTAAGGRQQHASFPNAAAGGLLGGRPASAACGIRGLRGPSAARVCVVRQPALAGPRRVRPLSCAPNGRMCENKKAFGGRALLAGRIAVRN
jgi:hypothetical protein